MGKPSEMDGCRAKCWDTGSARYHEPGCPNVAEEHDRKPAWVRPWVRGAKNPLHMPVPDVLGGSPGFISDAEREWHNIAAPYAKCPAEQVLFAIVRGHRVSGSRLVWAYEHAKRGTREKEMLGARLRLALNLPADAPLVKAVANG